MLSKVISSTLRERCVAIAKFIGEQLRSPRDVLSFFDRARQQVSLYDDLQWSPIAMSNGCTGVAILHSALDEALPNEGWSHRAHDQLAAAVSTRRSDISLFSGWSGFAVAAAYCSRQHQNYRVLVDQVSQLLTRYAASWLTVAGQAPLNSRYFDLIAGAAGHYLALGACDLGEPASAELEYLSAVVDRLERNGWRSLTDYYGASGPVEISATNLGISHGISGIGSALAVSRRSEREGDVAERIGDVLLKSTVKTLWGRQWPAMIVEGEDATPGRMAWCYGTPGTAIALWNIGVRTKRDDFKSLALETMKIALQVPRASWLVSDFGVCHGLAGLALLFMLIGSESACEELVAAAHNMTVELVDAFREDMPLGYRSDYNGEQFDGPGLLDGAAGVGLSLLTLSGACDSAWLRWFAMC